MENEKVGHRNDQVAGNGKLNNNWIGLMALLIALALPHVFNPIWAEFSVEASVPSAVFFLIAWAATSRTGNGRLRIATTWYLAGIAFTAVLVGLVRFSLGLIIGGRAVFHPSELMNVVLVLVLPVSFALFVSSRLRSRVAVFPPDEKQLKGGTEGK